jgi:hypothetical protein
VTTLISTTGLEPTKWRSQERHGRDSWGGHGTRLGIAPRHGTAYLVDDDVMHVRLRRSAAIVCGDREHAQTQVVLGLCQAQAAELMPGISLWHACYSCMEKERITYILWAWNGKNNWLNFTTKQSSNFLHEIEITATQKWSEYKAKDFVFEYCCFSRSLHGGIDRRCEDSMIVAEIGREIGTIR